MQSSSSVTSATTAATSATGVGGGESLRDYWKRRAEESKERVNATSNNSSLEDNSVDQQQQTTQQQMAPPLSRPPRDERSSKRPSSSTRQVDSIASALTSHTPVSTSTTRQNAVTTTADNDNTNSLSPIHRVLEKASWKELHQYIIELSKSSDPTEIAAQLSIPHPRDGGTTLHVASWKAPPSLGAMMIQLMPENSREMAVLQSIRDGEGNTPLHLCCGNLEYTEDGIDYLAVLKAIVKVAPKSAWTMQNSEGDTPLHMLVTSSLCAASVGAADDGGVNNKRSAEKLALEAVKLALKADTVDCATMKERTGATPLHVALAHGAHDCVIEALLDAAPSAAEVEDGRGMLPLHWAAAFGRVGHGVVKRLINAYPQAVTCVSIDGDIPLHLAVANATIDGGDDGRSGSGSSSNDGKVDRNRLKIVELLMNDTALKSSPFRDASDVTSPILTANREKLTPLHCCALFDAPSQISKLLMKHQDANKASSMTNSFGATPLHLAAAQPGVSQSIATVLSIGTPDAAAVQDRLKRTPLHVAAQNTYATSLLIKTLAELNPGAAGVKTQRGHLPLHLAAQSQAKEPVIRALIKAYPAAAEAKNKSNNTPLHDAAKYRASLGVVKMLYEAHPKALYVQNQYGNLPLHCATAYQAPSEVVQLLLKSWPEGASVQNRNKDAPIHYAAAYATSASSVRPLIEAAPSAVLVQNSSGQTPIDRAKANNAPADIVRLLEDAAERYSRMGEC
jgi:ankyrin repeat protein